VIVIIVVLVIVALAGCVQDSGNSSPTNNPNMTLVTEKIIVAGQNGIINQGGANQNEIDITPQHINLSLGVSTLTLKGTEIDSGTIEVLLPGIQGLGQGNDFWQNINNGMIFNWEGGSTQNIPVDISSFQIKCSSNFTGAIEIDICQYVPTSGGSN